jgi:hypothetical protein
MWFYCKLVIAKCKLQIEQRQNVTRLIILYQFQFNSAIRYIFELAIISGKRYFVDLSRNRKRFVGIYSPFR